ncbi:MAG: rod shape-determining protein RodA [Planctomycetes bacterium]|nr:rod shape-determining protein RodA [Planctomycetota bacterium]MCL4730938.1 rod shape-determining protein RodA [Planctomycetota bacterium]
MRSRLELRRRISLLRALPLGVVLPALALCGLGIAFIYSASNDFERVADGLARESSLHLRQAQFALVGLMLMLGVALMPPRWLSGAWYLWLAAGLCMLLAVFVFGRTVNGAKSWIVIGPLSLQPSELCKPLLVVALAGYLRYHQRVDSFAAFAVCLLIAGAFLVPILLQPDLGSAMVFIPVVAAMIWVAGGNRVYLGGLAAAGLCVIPLAYLSGALKEHQVKRIDIYLSSLQGDVADRAGDGYQILQSMTAIGSGGLTGQGFGAGVQSQLAFLPERHNDFIFAVYAQETGLTGVAAYLVLLFVMLACMLSIARRTREPFSRLVVVGVTALFFAQTFINIGVVSGVLPVTGITLPLMSYGGSSLLSSFLALGLVCNVCVQPARVMGKATF